MAPKLGPEVQKLGYYVGTWVGQGESRGGPLGPAGKLSSRMTCDWFIGGYQVICRGEETGPTGTRGFLNILSYDEKARTYTEYAISSLGDSEYDPGGSLVGNRLTYLVHQEIDGKPVKFRYMEMHASPVLMTYRAEAARGGSPWRVIAEGKITNIK
ncbi:MAG TPA: hypothetical protein VHT03_03080 [Rhizomicrobium sp.]|nr:hypothetical protein [Rhizomicrobium sp.]